VIRTVRKYIETKKPTAKKRRKNTTTERILKTSTYKPSVNISSEMLSECYGNSSSKE